ncbi:hypothetical protein SFRURICE_000820 [Spodoptera frugiperda]|nr:hypothetical protein SFRURICE_000820 [Spodoptera frugiperda]
MGEYNVANNFNLKLSLTGPRVVDPGVTSQMLHELHTVPHAHQVFHPDPLLWRPVYAVVPYILHEGNLVRAVTSAVALPVALSVPLAVLLAISP